tara:strand:+ start:10687 stop:11826 length:1140 start_codon:yes stop_codon:yes gene_type:complete
MNKADRLQNIQEYYFSKKLREVRGLSAQGKPIINMGIGSPDLQPPQEVISAIKEAVSEEGAHKYQSYQGLPEFRKAIANFYNKQYDVAINYENEILPLTGSKEGVLHISMAFLNKGDGVLIPNPGYPTYTSVSHLVEATPIFYDLKKEQNWQPDFDKLEQQNLTNIKLMWVNYPHMPTGANASLVLFKKLIAFGKKHDILIINDNPYSFVLNNTPLSILNIEGAKEIALELNSLSKSFNMAGWRVGMLIGDKDILAQVLKVKTQMDSGMFYGIQKGAVAALNMSSDWFECINKVYQKRRKLIWKMASLLNCSYDQNSSGMFVWAKIPEGKSAENLVEELLYEKNIFIAPGTIFGSRGEGYIRFSLCVAEEKIIEALNRL